MNERLLRLLGQFPDSRYDIEKLVGNGLAHMLGIISNRLQSSYVAASSKAWRYLYILS